jgi:Bacterial PH domain
VSSQSSAVPNRGVPVAGREVFRLTAPVVVWWIWVVFAAANVIDLAVQGSSAHSGLVIGAILLLVSGFAYALALRPRVVADQAGITIVNPFRDHRVPWTVIQGVDAGDWVRVHHTRDGSAVTAVDVPGQAIECWALYVSARAKRRDALGAPPPRSGGLASRAGFGQPPDEMARLPAEAKYLASLPPARAIAVRLDTRAAKERARLGQAGRASADSGPDGPARPAPVIARWAWFPFAAIAVPALALIIVALA